MQPAWMHGDPGAASSGDAASDQQSSLAMLGLAAKETCAHMREFDPGRALREQNIHDVPRSEAACILAGVGATAARDGSALRHPLKLRHPVGDQLGGFST